jgi:hypothetical protein
MQDPNCRLFVLESPNLAGCRAGSLYSFKSHPHVHSAAAYFDIDQNRGPCFGCALNPKDHGYGLSFFEPPVSGREWSLYVKANRHLAGSFGLNDPSDLTFDVSDQWELSQTSTLRIYAVERAPAGSIAAPRLGTAPAGVSFDAQVRPTAQMEASADVTCIHQVSSTSAEHSSTYLTCGQHGGEELQGLGPLPKLSSGCSTMHPVFKWEWQPCDSTLITMNCLHVGSQGQLPAAAQLPAPPLGPPRQRPAAGPPWGGQELPGLHPGCPPQGGPHPQGRLRGGHHLPHPRPPALHLRRRWGLAPKMLAPLLERTVALANFLGMHGGGGA